MFRVNRIGTKVPAIRKLGLHSCSTALLLATTALTSPILVGHALAQNLPQGGSVVSGSATIAQPSASALNITQSSSRAVINWNSFSIGQPNSVTFIQPSSSAAALNRVTGSTPSSIAGQLTANGQVYLVNPNGIAITPSGNVNVGGGFVASTLDITNDNFMSGNLVFRGNGSSASVVNQGRIKTASGGFVGLFGGTVSNSGLISVPLGKIGVGSGEQVTLDLYGDRMMQIALPTNATTPNGKALIEVAGKIRANGGQIQIEAASVRQAIRDTVNVSGIVTARSISGRNGSIVLNGGAGGNVRVAGKLNVSGRKRAGSISVSGANVALTGAKFTAKSKQGTGGNITVTAPYNIAIANSTIDASGSTGGGDITIGGGRQGQGPLQHAATVSIDNSSVIRADANATGNGGNVVVWSDLRTTFAGTISARGGAQGGNGGEVEVSSKGVLDYRGVSDLSAVKGQTGTLLLDPDDYTVDATAAGIIGSNLALSNVTIQTTAGGVGGNGDITVASALNWGSSNTLTLNAYRNIAINAGVTGTNGGLSLLANNTITATAPVSVGTFTLQGGSWSQVNASLPAFAATDFRITGGSFLRTLGGNGSSGSPYQIADSYGLQGIGSSTGLLSSNYVLANNIDATGTSNWNAGAGFVPIGNSVNNFQGSFNGQNYIISNLVINRPTNSTVGDYTGLFGFVGSGGLIENVGLIGGTITGETWVAALAGMNHFGTIQSSYATGTVNGTNRVGGLVGANNNGSITQSYATGVVNGTTSQIGGLVGVNTASGIITQSYATGNVSGTQSVGGLVGYNFNSSISQSYASGAVSGNYRVGGLIGLSDTGSSITQSYATGAVSGTVGSLDVGGLVGWNNTGSSITQSYATGAVSGTTNVGGLVGINIGTVTAVFANGHVNGTTNVGGLVGINNGLVAGAFVGVIGQVLGTGASNSVGGLVGSNAGSVYYAYALAPVSGSTNVGGLSGSNTGSVTQTYATGGVNGTTNVGGLIGNNTGAVTQSYWDTTTTGLGVGSGAGSSAGIAGLTSTGGAPGAAFYTAANFSGWSFGSSPIGAANNCSGYCWVIIDANGTLNNAGGATGATRPFLLGEWSSSIYNAHQLQLAALNLGAHYTLANNIDLGPGLTSVGGQYPGMWGAAGFVPIGNNATPFTGIFDGQNYTISNLVINRPTNSTAGDYAGLFGFVGTAGLIENVGLIGGGAVTGENYVGDLVGMNYGSIRNSYATGSVSGIYDVGGLVGVGYSSSITQSYATGVVSGTSYVGGLVGYNWGSITQSHATGTVSGTNNYVGGLVGMAEMNGTSSSITQSYATGALSGTSYVGGLVGYNWGSITQSHATGTVSGTNNYVGGLVGYNYNNANITQSYATGMVSSSVGSFYVGGLVGMNDTSSSITQSYAIGAVSGDQAVGGLVGYNNDASITQSYATGAVSGTNNYVGGLVGTNAGSSIIAQSYATGTVSGSAVAWFVGGLVGYNNNASITQSYAIGAVSGTNNYVGGLVGYNYNNASITQSYATGAVSGSAGSFYVGGLVGMNDTSSSIAQSYAIGAVSGNNNVGGLVGLNNNSNITQSYATGAVSGTTNVGGLVGTNSGGSVTQSYWDTDTTGMDAAHGLGGASGGTFATTGQPTSFFMTASNFSGWNFGTSPIGNSNTCSGACWVIVDANGSLNNLSGAAGATRPFLLSEYSTTIVNAHQLQLAALNMGAHYTLANNVDLGPVLASVGGQYPGMWGSAGFVPIGNNVTPFTGIFDGQNYTISNLVINRPTNNATGDYTGLFGYTLGATVMNLGILGGSVTGENYIGGLVGFSDPGSVVNSYSTSSVSGHDRVGGLIGFNDIGSTVAQSSASGAVSGVTNVGGLVGENSGGTIQASFVTASANIAGTTNIGGLVGNNNQGTISQSTANAVVSGTSNIGGLVGSNNQGTILNSAATSDVTGSINIGGLVGNNNQGTISNSAATSDVTGSINIGGLVGLNNQGTISNSTATSDITGFINIGGLVGRNNQGTISGSRATSNVGELTGDGPVHSLLLNTVVSSIVASPSRSTDDSDNLEASSNSNTGSSDNKRAGRNAMNLEPPAR